MTSILDTPQPNPLREKLAEEGWIHEDDLDAATGTTHRGRRRWSLPGVMLGNERYHRIEDVLARMREEYEYKREEIEEREAERKRAARGLA